MDSFLKLLHSFSLNLSASEVASLKFLCRHKVRKRRLESVENAMDLFTILLEQQDVTRHDVAFLEELLKSIKREDLVSQLKQFVEEGEVNAHGDQLDAHEKSFEVICNNVGRNWKMLARKLGLSEVQIDGILTAHPQDLREQVFQSLREWQRCRGRDAKVTDLIKALRDCDMNLVADKVQQ
ncbi:FADD protein, partial [Brachypteracias leptosomus]|nr:FADD protein [Brachypteracias leptosomus]